MNDGSGFHMDAFDTSPYVMTPYNPPSYPQYVARAGYAKVEDRYAWLIHDSEDVGDRVRRLAARVETRCRPVVRSADLKRLDQELALFIELGGEVAAVAIALPNINQVLKRIRGRLVPFGFVTLLNRRKHIDQLRLPILGILPPYRRRGLALVLMKETIERGQRRGYRSCECSWILEDDEPMNAGIRAAGGALYNTYRLYQKAL